MSNARNDQDSNQYDDSTSKRGSLIPALIGLAAVGYVMFKQRDQVRQMVSAASTKMPSSDQVKDTLNSMASTVASTAKDKAEVIRSKFAK